MPDFIRTLRLKVRPESYRWLNAAAVEVNQVFNYANEISFTTATRTDLKRKWLSGFDLCSLTAGATESHDRDVNAARNILASGFRCRTSVGNEPSPVERPPSQITHLREAGPEALQAAA